MPQFDFAHVFWPQFIWLGLFFAVLYFGIVRATLPKLGKVMDARDATIEGDLAAARAAKDSADAISERYHAEIATAREAARDTIAEAKVKATKASEARLHDAGAAADARIAAAEARIADAVGAAHAELRTIAAESAGEIVTRLTGSTPAADMVAARVAPLIGA